jgi:hypothetical protein
LDQVLARAPVFIYGFLGIGHLHEDCAGQIKVTDMKLFLDFARRLTVPCYEEARYFWADAHQDSMLDGRHEYSAYDPDFLQEIIMRYGPFGGNARGIASNVIVPISTEIELYSERLLTIVRKYELGAAFQINPDFGAEVHAPTRARNLCESGRRHDAGF